MRYEGHTSRRWLSSNIKYRRRYIRKDHWIPKRPHLRRRRAKERRCHRRSRRPKEPGIPWLHANICGTCIATISIIDSTINITVVTVVVVGTSTSTIVPPPVATIASTVATIIGM